MNINVFFLLIISGLVMIFFLFKPLEIKAQASADIPIFEVENFSLTELNDEGLSLIILGENALKYKNRYLINKIDYTDNSKKYLTNLQADKGLYKGDIISLDGNITFNREDGITFQTQKANYNKITNIVKSDTKYISHIGENTLKGSFIEYNSVEGTTKSAKVIITYKLKDK